MSRIEENGFDITRTKEVQLTPEQVEEFYAAKKDEPIYTDLVQEMTRYNGYDRGNQVKNQQDKKY